MKFKNIVTVSVVAFILISCTSTVNISPTESANSTLTITPFPITFTNTPIPSPTPHVYSSYPPCVYLFFAESIPVSLPTKQFSISDELILKEYGRTSLIQEQKGRCRFFTRLIANEVSEITLDQSFRFFVNPIGVKQEKVVVMQNNEIVYETKVTPLIYSGLLAAWAYDNHWVIEITRIRNDTENKAYIDIIRDGVSLKEETDYQEVYAFQLIHNKPLFFFIKYDNTFGINYNGAEFPLNYDDAPRANIHPGIDDSIEQYQDMVLFPAQKKGVWYHVAIGVFNK